MKSVVIAIVLSFALWAQLALYQSPWSPIWSALGAVAVGILAASAAQSAVTWLSVAAGSFSALTLAWLGPHSLWAATAVMAFLWLAPRCWYARTNADARLIGLAALLGAVIAGYVTTAYLDAQWLQLAAACVFGGAVLGLGTLLVSPQHPIGAELLTASEQLKGPVGEALARASRAWEQPNRGTRSEWRALVRMANERVALDRAKATEEPTRAELDQGLLEAVQRLVGLSRTKRDGDEATKRAASSASTEAEAGETDAGGDSAQLASTSSSV